MQHACRKYRESIACRSEMLRLANSLSHSGLLVIGLRGRAIEATVAENTMACCRK